MGITKTQPLPVRNPSLDVTRTIALFGVVVMNYHAYLNKEKAFYPQDPSFAERVFNPVSGILTTRFAATFVLVAGIGIALLMNSALRSEDPRLIRNSRMKLARRGLFLLAIGALIQWIWPGTILFYYGVYFLIASIICTWKTRNLVLVSLISIAVSTSVSAWRASEFFDGNFTQWLSPAPNSPRNLLIRTFLDYTHPVFPWITFICAGIVLGRNLENLSHLRSRIVLASGLSLAAAIFARTLLTPESITTKTNYVLQRVLSTNNVDHSVLHVVSTLAVALIAFCLVSWAIDSRQSHPVTQFMARTGQMTLSIYLVHVFVFNFVVHWMNWVRPTGLDTALILSTIFYLIAVPISAGWIKAFGTGPIERVYRAFGG